MQLDISDFEQYMIDEELSDNTRRSYVCAVEHYFSHYSEVTKANVLAWKQQLISESSSATVNLRLCGLRKYCEFKEIPVTVKQIRIQKASSVENIITLDEYHTLINGLEADGELDKAAYLKILAKTGARVSEAVRFTKSDLDRGYSIMHTKGKVRKILFPQSLVSEISPLFSGLKPNDVIFRSPKGLPYTKDGVRLFLVARGKRYGIRPEVLHPHSFRHMFAVEFLKHNSNIALLADLLGHSNVNITQIYLRMSQEQQKDALDSAVNW